MIINEHDKKQLYESNFKKLNEPCQVSRKMKLT